MISAKDIFTLEREMIAELQSLAYRANLSQEEMDEVFKIETEAEYEERLAWLMERQTSELVKVKNGETLKASEINKAVEQAVKQTE